MKDVVRKISEHCLINGIDASENRINLVAKVLFECNSKENIIMALNAMARSHKWFPTPADVGEYITKLTGGMTSSEEAYLATQEILDAIRLNGFDPARVKQEIGEQYYKLLGGAVGIDEYGSGRTPEGVFRKQLADRLKSAFEFKKNTGKEYLTDGTLIQIANDRRNELRPLNEQKALA